MHFFNECVLFKAICNFVFRQLFCPCFYQAVPLSAELLLGKFQKLPDGTHIVGGKEIKSYGIDAETGKVRSC